MDGWVGGWMDGKCLFGNPLINNNVSFLCFCRSDERPGFSVVEPRLRHYYYDISQWWHHPDYSVQYWRTVSWYWVV